MTELSFSHAAAAIGARHIGPEAWIRSVSTDTRTLRAGDLFVALKGPNFDGHDHLEAARGAGAAGALVERESRCPMPLLAVPDSRLALGRLGATWRRRSAAQVVAITGSNGKTTVKEMLAAILGQVGKTLATGGNLNNDIGVPLTLLRLQDEAYAAVEMGANHAGEIAYLTALTRPDVALLINAGRAHLEGFGSLEGVARAKAEIAQGLGPQGLFVFDADAPWVHLWRQQGAHCRVLTFGLGEGADVRLDETETGVEWDADGFSSRFRLHLPAETLDIKLHLGGAHNRRNALAAAAAAHAAGIPAAAIGAGLAALRPLKGRLDPLPGRHGVGLIDDSYNANPDSVLAAIDLLGTAPGRRFLVLGELAEMGPQGQGFYAEIGAYAREQGIDGLYVTAEACAAAAAFGPAAECHAEPAALIAALEQRMRAGDRVLVKGSRRARMERVIQALQQAEAG